MVMVLGEGYGVGVSDKTLKAFLAALKSNQIISVRHFRGSHSFGNLDSSRGTKVISKPFAGPAVILSIPIKHRQEHRSGSMIIINFRDGYGLAELDSVFWKHHAEQGVVSDFIVGDFVGLSGHGIRRS